LEREWRELLRREIPQLTLEKNIKTAVMSVARLAETNNLRVVNQAIFGLSALGRSEIELASYAMDVCSMLISFDKEADSVIDALLAGTAKEVPHG
jgi:hypothetical protein